MLNGLKEWVGGGRTPRHSAGACLHFRKTLRCPARSLVIIQTLSLQRADVLAVGVTGPSRLREPTVYFRFAVRKKFAQTRKWNGQGKYRAPEGMN